MNNNIKPNFFIVGAAKSATTSIYHYLKNHPDVFFPNIKEPKYFSSKYIKFPQKGPGDEDFTDKWVFREEVKYLELYKNAKKFKIRGDASVDNLYYYSTAEDIKCFNPEAKILIILRNPVERAFSHYQHFIRDKRETEEFEIALSLEQERKKQGYEFSWFYKEVGLYYEQLKVFKSIFNENCKVILFEEFQAEPEKHISEICEFLCISSKPLIGVRFIKHNSSGISKSSLLSKIINGHFPLKFFLKRILPFQVRSSLKAWLNEQNNIKMSMEVESRKKLFDYYRNDIQSLQILLERNLDIWK